jgi:hypothetical protein
MSGRFGPKYGQLHGVPNEYGIGHAVIGVNDTERASTGALSESETGCACTATSAATPANGNERQRTSLNKKS